MQNNNEIRLWNLESGTEKTLLDAQRGDRGPSIEFTPDGRRLISAQVSENVVESWDTETGRLITKISTPRSGTIEGLSTDGRYALLSGEYRVDEQSFPLFVLDVTRPDATLLPTGTEASLTDTEVSLPEVNGEIVVNLQGNESPRFSIDYSRRYLDSGGDQGVSQPIWSRDRSVKVVLRGQRSVQWQNAAGVQLHELQIPASAGRWNNITVSGNGSTVVLGDDRGRVLLARGETNSLMEMIQLPNVIETIAVDETGVGS